MQTIRIIVTTLLFALVATACGGSGGAVNSELAMTPTSLTGAQTGMSYGANLVATGGSGAGYAWEIASGTFPPGLAGFPSTGATASISGTLGAPGTYVFTLQLSDDAGASVAQEFTFVIEAAPDDPDDPVDPPATNVATSMVGAPAGRTQHTAIWTGTEMIVWGGFNRFGFLGNGGAFDPATNSWRAISVVNEPVARHLHEVVWTGTEMIVWGGRDSNGWLGTGGAYNPATDTWRTLSTTNAPEARLNHTAVWTGTAMIVYGGQGLTPPPAPGTIPPPLTIFDNGGSYDPVTDLWSAPALGPPADGPTAVWTGSRMITWGGTPDVSAGFQTLGSGGIYNPAGDTWIATPLTGAPTARFRHRAVWMGSAGMFVWGGLDALFQPLATGGRFDPNANQWTAVTTVGAPSARLYHTVVWTGTEAVVWGGGTNGISVNVNTGAAYNPATNTWRAMALGFTPIARRDHTAVWTGTAMIVWGGEPSTPADVYLNDGAVMYP